MTFVISWNTENEIEPKLFFFLVAKCLLTFGLLQILRICIWSLLFLIYYNSAQGGGKGITINHFSLLFFFAEGIIECPPRGKGVSGLLKPKIIKKTW